MKKITKFRLWKFLADFSNIQLHKLCRLVSTDCVREKSWASVSVVKRTAAGMLGRYGRFCGAAQWRSLERWRSMLNAFSPQEPVWRAGANFRASVGELNDYRRIASRFEKKTSHFKEMLAFNAIMSWLR